MPEHVRQIRKKENPMILYHGTRKSSAINIINNGIDLHRGKKRADFGKGFYLTPDLRTAKDWAIHNMMTIALERIKQRYIDAVKTALIANHGLSDSDAAASISAYQLQERFDLQPYIQLHYDVEDIADEIIEEGYSAASSH